MKAALARAVRLPAGALLADGGAPIEPARLIVQMLERFIATDRGFAKVRRNISNCVHPAKDQSEPSQ
ncbi:DUF2274 domain-containing protein [Sphingobium sp. CCH11-B1]|jgi:hypothetical protein|uniref:DUF2274 domain-containing protein n=1 Tax=Sphingobium sp. CCH11-B1 TaxID=1768781 RepID=UPI00082A9E84|nr:DUF2274 domain-containing protein [Sphingobium sp. CCH11-B1]